LKLSYLSFYTNCLFCLLHLPDSVSLETSISTHHRHNNSLSKRAWYFATLLLKAGDHKEDKMFQTCCTKIGRKEYFIIFFELITALILFLMHYIIP